MPTTCNWWRLILRRNFRCARSIAAKLWRLAALVFRSKPDLPSLGDLVDFPPIAAEDTVHFLVSVSSPLRGPLFVLRGWYSALFSAKSSINCLHLKVRSRLWNLALFYHDDHQVMTWWMRYNNMIHHKGLHLLGNIFVSLYCYYNLQ